MATTETEVLKQGTRLLQNISFAIDAAEEVSASYPDADRDYVYPVLHDLRKRLQTALVPVAIRRAEALKQRDAAKEK